ncbi:hypothetical protein Tco_1007391 [Tanacetum coccineum]
MKLIKELANLLHAKQLASLFSAEEINITANSMPPGFIVIIIDIFRGYKIFSVIVDKVLKYFVKHVAQGATTTCYIVLNPKVKGVTGKYFSDSNLAEPSMIAKDQDLAKELWDFSTGILERCRTMLKSYGGSMKVKAADLGACIGIL